MGFYLMDFFTATRIFKGRFTSIEDVYLFQLLRLKKTVLFMGS